jgi:hypothetical protein
LRDKIDSLSDEIR